MPWSTETFPEIPVTPEPSKRGRGKRRWSAPQKIVVTLLLLMTVGVFAGYGYLSFTEGKIDRIAASDLTSLVVAPLAEGESINFLIVGVDDRSTVPEDWVDAFGDFAGRRTDVMMIAHISDTGIQMLSIPRDWKSSIPGHGTNRVNAAYVFGGPDLLVETIQLETGIPIHHYVEIDFAGVGAVVDSLGGVALDFTYAGRDGNIALPCRRWAPNARWGTGSGVRQVSSLRDLPRWIVAVDGWRGPLANRQTAGNSDRPVQPGVLALERLQPSRIPANVR